MTIRSCTRHRIRCALAAALLLGCGLAQAEVAIIVHPSYTDELSADLVRDIYLGKNRQLKPVEQAKGSDDRQAFLDTVLEMSEKKFKRHWSKRIFSGKGKPPNSLSSAEAVIAFVATNENAIGYIDAALVTDESVKIAVRVE